MQKPIIFGKVYKPRKLTHIEGVVLCDVEQLSKHNHWFVGHYHHHNHVYPKPLLLPPYMTFSKSSSPSVLSAVLVFSRGLYDGGSCCYVLLIMHCGSKWQWYYNYFLWHTSTGR